MTDDGAGVEASPLHHEPRGGPQRCAEPTLPGLYGAGGRGHPSPEMGFTLLDIVKLQARSNYIS